MSLGGWRLDSTFPAVLAAASLAERGTEGHGGLLLAFCCFCGVKFDECFGE